MLFEGRVYVGVGEDPEHGEGVGHLWCIDPTKRGDVSAELAFNVSDLTKPIQAKHVLVIEDIVDTGLTMRYLLDNLATRHPASVKICALLHKPARARTKIDIDYLGFTIPDLFVVGYGLDYNEKLRNVPFIGVMKPGGVK